MSLDLTPAEIVRLVQGLKGIPEGLCVINERDELTLWENDPATLSLAEKINAEGERPDVIEYMRENYE